MENSKKIDIKDAQALRIYEQHFEDSMKLYQLISHMQTDVHFTVKPEEIKKAVTTGEPDAEKFKELASIIRQFDGEKVALVAIYFLLLCQKEWDKFLPYLYDVLLENPQWRKCKTLPDLVEDHIDSDGKHNSLWDSLLEQLKKRQEALKVTAQKTKTVSYPLDKVNFKVWNLLPSGNLDNIPIAVENGKSNTELSIYYAINFDELGNDIAIAKKLLPYDKRAYVAIAALFNAGNEVVTLTQIYHAMGFSGTPGSTDRDKINNSITKMRSAQIRIDNSQESNSYKYPKFIYDGSLLPSERVTAIVNNQLAEAAIHLFREPPLITFAKERKQLTTLDIKLLQSPMSKTDTNLQIEGYLIERIARARNKTGKPRILYQTILEQIYVTEMTPTKQKNLRTRLPNKVKKYLDYYIKCNNIKNYTSDTSGVTVYF